LCSPLPRSIQRGRGRKGVESNNWLERFGRRENYWRRTRRLLRHQTSRTQANWSLGSVTVSAYFVAEINGHGVKGIEAAVVYPARNRIRSGSLVGDNRVVDFGPGGGVIVTVVGTKGRHRIPKARGYYVLVGSKKYNEDVAAQISRQTMFLVQYGEFSGEFRVGDTRLA